VAQQADVGRYQSGPCENSGVVSVHPHGFSWGI
jgi:hypothetical protein